MIPELAKKKQPVQSIIEKVQHHTHESDKHKFTHIVPIKEILKPFLKKTSKAKPKQFCG